jgi:hypothetical protein
MTRIMVMKVDTIFYKITTNPWMNERVYAHDFEQKQSFYFFSHYPIKASESYQKLKKSSFSFFLNFIIKTILQKLPVLNVKGTWIGKNQKELQSLTE